MEEETSQEKAIIESKRKSERLRKLNILTNVFLIIVLVAIFIYILTNVESLKLLNGDVCKLCMQKTGATCFKVSP
jgi:uncharacterized integral membrane protein